MYIQVITYSLEGISEEEYLDVANQLASRIAGQPGLLAKIWLENEGGNRYGGIYFWEDLESMQRFAESELFEGRVPQFGQSSVEEFSVLENLTAQTQPVLEILEPPRAVTAAGPAAPQAKKVGAKKAGVKAVAGAAKATAVKKAGPKAVAPKAVASKKVAGKKSAVTKALAKKAPGKKAIKKVTG